jgi:enoyl-CoA hydratase
MNLESLIYEEKDNVAWITFNRPKALNAQNQTLLSELIGVLEEANKDDEVRVMVITGAGEKAFSAGADITEILTWSPLDFVKMFKGSKRAYELIREIPKPVIAMVNGYALGGGCEIAMACDMIIASENARFGLPEITIGAIPGGGGTQVLPRLIGEKRAKEMVFTGDFVSAQEAWRMGLVNRVVPREKLRETVEELAGKLKSKSPAIMRFAKLSVNKSLETPLSVGMASEMDFFAMCCSTEDQKEGAKAFLEKRAPVYFGK